MDPFLNSAVGEAWDLMMVNVLSNNSSYVLIGHGTPHAVPTDSRFLMDAGQQIFGVIERAL